MEKAVQEDIQIDIASFIETKNTIDETVARQIIQLAPKEIAAVFTSMNAAEAVTDFLKAINAEPDWTIYTLGGVTHTILKNYFLGCQIFSSANNAAQLAEAIIENEETEVFFFCGNQRRDELPGLLADKNITVEELVVYETIETPVSVKKKYDGLLFFSPSAVKSFFSANKIDADTVLFAIGSTTAQELKKFAANKILVATQPNKELLAEQAMDYLKNERNEVVPGI